MIININTVKNPGTNKALIKKLKDLLTNDLYRVTDDITLLEVHLSDTKNNIERFIDKRCMLVARLKNKKSISVIELADTHLQAVKGAINKLWHCLGSVSGCLSNF